MTFRTGAFVMPHSSFTRALIYILVASQLLAGVPALAAPSERARLDQPAQPAQTTAQPEAPPGPNRTVPAVTPPPTVFTLRDEPVDADLTSAHIFAEPLIPMPRGTTAAENRALTSAL